jgi:23S rRNA (uracil1939-C5)-methyltransferase
MLDVQIEKLVFGGMGLARTSAGVVLVPGVLPGEIVKITPEFKRGGVQVASVIEIIVRSSDRREPPCAYCGVCGGCDWLHIKSEAQIAFKREIFHDCFQRLGKMDIPCSIDTFTSPEFGYRIRAQLKIDKQGKAGFFKQQSNQVVPLVSCPLLSDEINSLFCMDFLKFTDTKNVRVIRGDKSLATSPVLQGFTDEDTSIVVSDRTFKVNGGDFFQSNRFLNGELGTWALPYIGGDSCIDLYGGAGFFSVLVSDLFKRGLLIESVHSQVNKANVNFINNETAHFKAVCSDAENLLSYCPDQPDLVIIDPPRPGLTRKVCHALATLKPQMILYVSCNVSTQARDCAFLVRQAGYCISRAALFDCYPNTCHLETAILLHRNRNPGY